MKDAGMSVNILTSTYGRDRNKEIAKCKFLVNIHYNADYKIFELMRCAPWLDIGFAVITEESLDNDERAIITPYDKLVERCKEYLDQGTIEIRTCLK
jgi:hypothetical protein